MNDFDDAMRMPVGDHYVAKEETEKLRRVLAKGAGALSPYAHDDYMTFHLHCAAVESARVEVGDVVWAPSSDGFNPWREMVQITEVRGNGWYMARAMGATVYRHKAELRWSPMSTTFYMARTVAEKALADS